MSITNANLISQALRDINVIAEGENASAAQGSQGLIRMNQLMSWLRDSEGVNIGYFSQTSTTAICPIPEWAELPVINMMSILLAPKHGATASLELATILGDSVNGLVRTTIVNQLDNTDMTHMPIGQGHYGRGYDIAKGE